MTVRIAGIDFGNTTLRCAIGELQGVEYMQNAMCRMPGLVGWDVDPASRRTRVRAQSLKRLIGYDGATDGSADRVSQTNRALHQLQSMKLLSCANTGVVALPPCFAQRQRAAIRELANAAGFQRVRLIDDTKAALLASGDLLGSRTRVLVYAWGSGSFSAAVWDCGAGHYELIGQEGDRELGGSDVDALLADYVLEQIGGDAAQIGSNVLTALMEKIEFAKRDRSPGQDIDITTGDLIAGLAPDFRVQISALCFEQIISRVLARTMELTRRALDVSGMRKPEAVLAVGGATPLALPDLRSEFGFVVRASDEAVAVGAARFGMSILQEEWESASVTGSAIEPGAGHTDGKRNELGPKLQGEAPNEETKRWQLALRGRLDRARNSFVSSHAVETQVPSVLKKVKVGRNERCSCGSGQKYKKCCGKGCT